jgi:hypothetical protein
MLIGAVGDPLNWDRWPEAERLLEPARELFGDDTPALGVNEAVYVVLDGDELLAVATAWLSSLGFAEVKLIGGRDHRRWLKELDEAIGAAARDAGAMRLTAIGRRGWWKTLKRLGWDRLGEIDDFFVFSRGL